jgi:dienelactone hydrolase/lysophospholipase L1-like esterase
MALDAQSEFEVEGQGPGGEMNARRQTVGPNIRRREMRTGVVVLLSTVGFFTASAATWGQADAPRTAELPKVVLVGDSIRLGYAPFVAKRLSSKAVVVSPPENGGDSANVLSHVDEWVLRQKPDVVHLNCGLHDLKRSRADGRHQVELEQYAENLRRIVARIRAGTDAVLVFSNTTPILDERHAQRGAEFDRTEADVGRYNAQATAIMGELGVPVDDLHWVVEQGGMDTMLGPDGTHYTAAGSDRLAEAVADCLLRHLTVRRYRPLPSPPHGPEATAEYQKSAARRDGLVPEVHRRVEVGKFRTPADAAAWKVERPAVLRAVVESMGHLPPRPAPPRARIISRELRPGYAIEKVALSNGVDGDVTALLLVPAVRHGKVPAILWLHSSTPDKTQVIISGTNGGDLSLGEAFVRAGYAVLSPDSYWHGDRAGTGPSGTAESGRAEQEDLFKINMWLGRTLWGMFVRDDQVALDYLCSRPEVDASRIGATGMSMGSTRAWWLAAVDERVAAVVAVACLTRYQNLIAHGDLRQHGVYYFVNGLLRHFDSEGVLALIAPRPFLALTGELDAGSPADGVRALERAVGDTYAALQAKDRFRSVLYPEVGHAYTPKMREEMLTWFRLWLRPQAETASTPR